MRCGPGGVEDVTLLGWLVALPLLVGLSRLAWRDTDPGAARAQD